MAGGLLEILLAGYQYLHSLSIDSIHYLWLLDTLKLEYPWYQ